MAKISGRGIDAAVAAQVIDFLNNAQTAKGISSLDNIIDDIRFGYGDQIQDYDIGEEVAQRILDKRKQLGGKFTDLSELSDIKGFGVDKFNDLINAFTIFRPAKTRRFPKVDLFRFTTLRQPKKVASVVNHAAYIRKPEKFVVSKKKVSIREDQLQQEFTDLWVWSVWLNDYKDKFDLGQLRANIKLEAYKDSNKDVLWNVILAEFGNPASADILQKSLLLLTGHHFLETYKAAQKAKDKVTLENLTYWHQVANATILLPKELATEKKISRPAPPIATKPIPSEDKKYRAIHQALVAEQELVALENLKKEFVSLSSAYTQERDAQESLAYRNYQKELAPVLQKLKEGMGPSYYILQAKNLSEEELSQLSPQTDIPEFNFSYPASLSPEFLEGRLSNAARTFVNKQGLQGKEAKDAIQLLEERVQTKQSQTAGKYQKHIKKINVNTVPVKPLDYHSLNFSIEEDTLGSHKFYLSFNTNYPNAFFAQIEAKLQVGKQEIATQGYKLLSNDTKLVLAELFDSEVLDLPKNTKHTFRASFVLDNGQTFRVEKTFHRNSSINQEALNPVREYHDAHDSANIVGVTRLGIADFRKVEQELCCYVPGEVSHIENVMAREYKEKETRNLVRTENTLEVSTEKEVEELNDTTTTTRFEMSSEVASVINKDRSSNFGFNASVNGSASMNTGVYSASTGFNVGGYGDFSFATSSQNSNTSARNYAEDVTRRALERIVQKTATKRTSTMIKEFEQNYKHGYDNRDGKEHVTGIYRWVDKIYKNRVVNYGKRLMYEFMVPEPARFFYKTMFEEASNNGNGSGTGNGSGNGGTTLVEPTPPSISNHLDITRNNYAQLAADYGATVTPPMAPEKTVPINISESIPDNQRQQNKNFNYNNLQVPVNYHCYELRLSMSFNFWSAPPFGGDTLFRHTVPNDTYTYPHNLKNQGQGSRSYNRNYTFQGNNTLSGTIPVSLNVLRIVSLSGSVVAECRLDANVFEQWQQETYQAIMDAYNAQLQAYNDAVAAQQAAAAQAAAQAAAEDEGEPDVYTNSALNQQIIVNELKRLCIEMMAHPFSHIQIGQDFYQDPGQCQNVPDLILNSKLDAYASIVKFFEQAFDWQLMAYLFYPYYYAEKCSKWQELMKRQNGVDHIFHMFLQSGMSRVVVPIREGFEKAVMYFMETGKVWLGENPPIIGDDLYLSIVQELETPAGEQVGEDWLTTVPSTLNIIQGRSVYLNEEGLPCCEKDQQDNGPTNLWGSDNLLERIKE